MPQGKPRKHISHNAWWVNDPEGSTSLEPLSEESLYKMIYGHSSPRFWSKAAIVGLGRHVS